MFPLTISDAVAPTPKPTAAASLPLDLSGTGVITTSSSLVYDVDDASQWTISSSPLSALNRATSAVSTSGYRNANFAMACCELVCFFSLSFVHIRSQVFASRADHLVLTRSRCRRTPRSPHPWPGPRHKEPLQLRLRPPLPRICRHRGIAL